MPPAGKVAQKAAEKLSKFLFGPAELVSRPGILSRHGVPLKEDAPFLPAFMPEFSSTAPIQPNQILTPLDLVGAAEPSSSQVQALAEGVVIGGSEKVSARAALKDFPVIEIGGEEIQPRDIGRLLGRLSADPEIRPTMGGIIQDLVVLRRAYTSAERLGPDTSFTSPLPAGHGFEGFAYKPEAAKSPQSKTPIPGKVVIGDTTHGDMNEIAAHELGHTIAGITDKSATVRYFLERAEIFGELERTQIYEEMRALSKRMRPLSWERSTRDGRVLAYLTSQEELLADSLASIMLFPQRTPQLAPRFIEVVREMNADPKFKKFGLSVKGLVPFVLAGAALQSQSPSEFDLREEREKDER